jgi:hypothetical protein
VALAKPSKRKLLTVEKGTPEDSHRLIKAKTAMTSRTFQIYRYNPDADANHACRRLRSSLTAPSACCWMR